MNWWRAAWIMVFVLQACVSCRDVGGLRRWRSAGVMRLCCVREGGCASHGAGCASRAMSGGVCMCQRLCVSR